MKEIVFMERNISISDDYLELANIKKAVDSIADKYTDKFIETYSTYTCIEDVSENALGLGFLLIYNAAEECLPILFKHNIYTIDKDVLFDKYYSKVSTWEDAFDKVNNQYLDIVMTEEQKDAYRTARRENRGRWVGGGFGLANALKGAAQAGALNMASGMLHGVFNVGAKIISATGAEIKKYAIFQNPNTLSTLREGIHSNIEFFSLIIPQIIDEINGEHLVPDIKVIESADSMIKNLKMIADDETKKNIICKAMESNPFNENIYKFCLKEYGTYAKDILAVGDTFSVDIPSMIDVDMRNIYNESVKSTETELLHLRNTILEKLKFYGLTNCQTIKQIDSDLNEIVRQKIEQELTTKNTLTELRQLKDDIELFQKNNEIPALPAVSLIQKKIEKEEIKEELSSVKHSNLNELSTSISKLREKGYDVNTIDEQVNLKFNVSSLMYLKVLQNALNFKGRATRQEFWPCFFLFNIVAVILCALSGAIITDAFDEQARIVISVSPFVIAFLLLQSVAVRRLHDANFSGWWLILFYVIYIVHPVLWIILAFTSTDDNKYGPKPKI